MAEIIRNGGRYNAATHRYLGPATSVDEAVASLPDEETTSEFQSMKVADLKALLDEAEVEYPSKATKALLAEIAENEL